eukprot:m.57266 g.57266  ORF g.57266 m.57266 type:complete len:64 (-) comp17066_c0_seq2:84-275(-)
MASLNTSTTFSVVPILGNMNATQLLRSHGANASSTFLSFTSSRVLDFDSKSVNRFRTREQPVK